MASLSPTQIAAAMKAAGWPESTWATGIQVALAESSGRTDLTNANTNGSTDYGLFQINSVHAAILKGGDWKNPVQNARMALAVYTQAGKKWSPWVAYNTGKYKVFHPQGTAGVFHLKKLTEQGKTPAEILRLNPDDFKTRIPIIDDIGDAVGTAQNAYAQVATVVKFVTDGHTWLRVGMGVGGAVLIVMGVLLLASQFKVTRQAVSAIPMGRVARGLKGVT